MKFGLDYARKVIEAEAIKSVTPIVDASFAKAVEMIYNCSGSCIVSGIGKAGIIGQKISADALAAEATAIFHKYRIDELPVVDAANKPVGLIDVQDILTIKVVG